MENNESLLILDGLRKSFGGLQAVAEITFNVKPGQFKGVIGPNGAGKTTLFNLVSGYYKLDEGKIIFDNNEITHLSPDRIVNLGIGRTFQEIRIMENVKVIDIVKTAFFRSVDYGIFDILFNTTKYKNNEKRIEERAMDLLDFFGILNLKDIKIDNLSYGQQRRVSICRALALRPKILLLDEPTAGLNIGETDEIVKLILKIKKQYNLSIVMIEHDMKVIMDICDEIVAINEGRSIAEGSPSEIQENQLVIKSYLGE